MIEKERLCSNCKGRLPGNVHQCPYCFLSIEEGYRGEEVAATTEEEQSLALYPPSYRGSSESSEEIGSEIHSPTESSSEKEPHHLVSTLLSLLGGHLLTLGALQFLFSDHGVIRLEIDARYWFLLILLSLPLLYWGLKDKKP